MQTEELKALLVARILNGHGSCNGNYLSHLEGQVRALEYVITKQIPPPAPLEDVPALLDRLDIPWNWLDDDKEFLGFQGQWLIDHGFEKTDTDYPEHPEYSKQW